MLEGGGARAVEATRAFYNFADERQAKKLITNRDWDGCLNLSCCAEGGGGEEMRDGGLYVRQQGTTPVLFK